MSVNGFKVNNTVEKYNYHSLDNLPDLEGAIAEEYSNTKAYSVGDYVWYNGILKRCIVNIPSSEEYTASHWETARVAKDFGITKREIEYQMKKVLLNRVDGEHNGITYKWNGEVCEITGATTMASASVLNLISPHSSLPGYIKPGTVLRCIYEATSSAISLSIVWFDSNSNATYTSISETQCITVPSTAVTWSLRIYVATSASMGENGQRVNKLQIAVQDGVEKLFSENVWEPGSEFPVGSVVNYNGVLYNVYNNSNVDGQEYVLTETSIDDELLALKRTLPDGANILPILSNKDTKTTNGITYTWVGDSTIRMNGTASTDSFYNFIISRQQMIPGVEPGDDVLVKIGNMPYGASVLVYYYTGGTTTSHLLTYTTYTTFTRLIRIPDNATGLMFRISVSSGTVIGNVDATVELIVKPKIKHIRALFIGNSYTNDCVNYAPFIAEGLSKGVAFTIGTTYYSGASINDYVDWFDNDTATLTYYKKHGLFPKWNAGVANQTLKQCIADEPWDIIVFQQSSSDQGTWSTFSNLNTLINKVLSYNATLHSKAVKIGWMFPQLRYSIIGSTTYANVVECVQNVLNTTPIDFFIPCGTAVQNARGTSLDSIGSSGHLCADSNGHLQAGLPSLLASYVSALKLLELAGEPWHGILQETTRPTATWVTNINSPGENGTSTGVTDANCYLAQKCAVAAMKFPTTVSTIS